MERKKERKKEKERRKERKKNLQEKELNHEQLKKHQSFVCTQLNDQTVPFLAIHFSISHLFALSLNVKQFYLTHR